MSRQWSRLSLDPRFPKRRRIGPRRIARNASSLIIFCSPYSNCWRTRGTNRRRGFLIRRTGLDGKVCFENIIMPKEYVGFGGRVADMPIRQSFKNTWPGRNRRKTSATWAKYSIDPLSKVRRNDVRCGQADGRLTEVIAQGSLRSVHVAKCAADAIATSGSGSSDPSLSDSAGPPPALQTALSLGRAR